MQNEQDARNLITVAQMRAAEARVIGAGTPGIVLMERAGRAVADAIRARAQGRAAVAVLCGPGNNGGDGYVIARLMKDRGHPVTVYGLVPAGALSGDAARAAALWDGLVHPPQRFLEVAPAEVTVVALFGTGLARDVTGEAAAMIAHANATPGLKVAVDIPSGINGDTGAAMGSAFRADLTVTFHALKPGHVLAPGCRHAGEIVVADIGLGAEATALAQRETDGPELTINAAAGLLAPLGQAPDGHKYTRGHCLVLAGGLEGTGAARLAARGALRAGAGLVTLGVPGAALLAHASRGPDALMIRRCNGAAGIEALLKDARLNAVVLGPAYGVAVETRQAVATVAVSRRAAVLDADALTAFAGAAEDLALITRDNGRMVLTPHAGEFSRLFEGQVFAGLSKLQAALGAAAMTGSVVVFKGPDTVIAAPDGRAAINTNAPVWLGTAGSGDVLAGLIGGLLAQGLAPFDAARAGVWLHGAAGHRAGRGLIADDLPEAVRDVLASLR